MKQNIFIHDIYTLYIYSLLIFKYFFNINLFILKLIKTSTLVKKKIILMQRNVYHIYS